jgi:hypothetical protein
MYANTITLTINAVAKVLQRGNQDNYGVEYSYRSATEIITMKIRHTPEQKDAKTGLVMLRHNVFVEHTVYPTVTDLMKRYSATLTLRHGEFNDPAASAYLARAVNVFFGTSTNMEDLAVGGI